MMVESTTRRTASDPGRPYWLVIYTTGDSKPRISLAVSAETEDQAYQLWMVTAAEGTTPQSLAGPFDSREQAYGYRGAWWRGQGR